MSLSDKFGLDKMDDPEIQSRYKLLTIIEQILADHPDLEHIQFMIPRVVLVTMVKDLRYAFDSFPTGIPNQRTSKPM